MIFNFKSKLDGVLYDAEFTESGMVRYRLSNGKVGGILIPSHWEYLPWVEFKRLFEPVCEASKMMMGWGMA